MKQGLTFIVALGVATSVAASAREVKTDLGLAMQPDLVANLRSGWCGNFTCEEGGPDRHGHIPDPVAARLRELGQWMKGNAEAIYGTHAGPWQPVEGQYGFTCRDNKIFVYLLGGYTDTSLVLPPLQRGQKVRRAYVVESDQKVRTSQRGQTVTLSGLPAAKGQVTIVALEL